MIRGSKLLLIFLITIIFCSTLPTSGDLQYSESGTLYDNGDNQWDVSEWKMIKYVLKPGEDFEIQVGSTGGDVSIIYMKGNDWRDIERVLFYLTFTGASKDAYFYGYTVNGYLHDTYRSNKRISAKLAIFTGYDHPVTISYKISTNIPSGTRGITQYIAYGAIAALIIAVIVIVNKNNKKKQLGHSPSSNYYKQPVYPPYSINNYSTHQSSNMQNNLQSTSSGNFCYNCGSQLSGLYCNNCGTKN